MSFGVKISRKGKGPQRAAQALDDSVEDAIKDAVLAIHANAVRGVMKRSQGKRQTRYNPKRTVTASKPGDPPNVDLGTFVKSIQFEVDEHGGAVGTNDKRGPWFEFGTKDMEARPWLAPAIKQSKAQLKKIFKKVKIKLT